MFRRPIVRLVNDDDPQPGFSERLRGHGTAAPASYDDHIGFEKLRLVPGG